MARPSRRVPVRRRNPSSDPHADAFLFASLPGAGDFFGPSPDNPSSAAFVVSLFHRLTHWLLPKALRLWNVAKKARNATSFLHAYWQLWS
jgi:hypothetical protein